MQRSQRGERVANTFAGSVCCGACFTGRARVAAPCRQAKAMLDCSRLVCGCGKSLCMHQRLLVDLAGVLRDDSPSLSTTHTLPCPVFATAPGGAGTEGVFQMILPLMPRPLQRPRSPAARSRYAAAPPSAQQPRRSAHPSLPYPYPRATLHCYQCCSPPRVAGWPDPQACSFSRPHLS